MARSSRRRERIKSDINLTPLIDVMISYFYDYSANANQRYSSHLTQRGWEKY